MPIFSVHQFKNPPTEQLSSIQQKKTKKLNTSDIFITQKQTEKLTQKKQAFR